MFELRMFSFIPKVIFEPSNFAEMSVKWDSVVRGQWKSSTKTWWKETKSDIILATIS